MRSLKEWFESDTGEIVSHVIWALGALFLVWVIHAALVFPFMMFMRELEQHKWNPFDMGWQSWKECLIPSAVYVPVHLFMLG